MKRQVRRYQKGGYKLLDIPANLVPESTIDGRGRFKFKTEQELKNEANYSENQRVRNENARRQSILEQEKTARQAQETNSPYKLPSGETKKYSDMTRGEQRYMDAQSLKHKGRLDQENANSGLSQYEMLNPFGHLYNLAASLGEGTYKEEKTGDSSDFWKAAGTGAATGLVAGIGAPTTAQFVNNLVNPLAGIIGTPQELIQVAKSFRNRISPRMTSLDPAQKELLSTIRNVGHLANSGPLYSDINLLESINKKASSLGDNEFRSLTGFDKSDVSQRIQELRNAPKKASEYVDELHIPDNPELVDRIRTGVINLQRPARRTRPSSNPSQDLPLPQGEQSYADQFRERLNNTELYSNQLPDLPEELFLDIGERHIPSKMENIYNNPSLLNRLNSKISNTMGETALPVTEVLIPSLAKHAGNNPAKEILSAYRKVEQAPKGSSFIPAHSLSTDSYPISMNLIDRAVKNGLVDVGYHGHNAVNNLGFAQKAGINPSINLTEFNSLIDNLNKNLPNKVPYAKLEGNSILYPNLSVTRKRKGGSFQNRRTI